MPAGNSPPFDSFEAFYRLFLAAHRNAWNRRVHLLGWLLGLGFLAWALATRNVLLLPLAPASGLAAIWVGHGLIEPGAEIEFKYPFWTAWANLRMFWDMARGRLPDWHMPCG